MEAAFTFWSPEPDSTYPLGTLYRDVAGPGFAQLVAAGYAYWHAGLPREDGQGNEVGLNRLATAGDYYRLEALVAADPEPEMCDDELADRREWRAANPEWAYHDQWVAARDRAAAEGRDFDVDTY